MKTKRNWIIIAITVIMSGSLAGCVGDGQNAQDFEAVPSYMTMKNGNYCMETLAGDVYVSGLSASDIGLYDTFGLSWFNINYDEQPQGTDGINVPYTAVIRPNGWFSVDANYMRVDTEELPEYYTDTILDAGLLYSQLLRNHAFFVMRQNAPSKREYSYHMTMNLDSTALYNDIPALYVQNSISNDDSGSATLVDHVCAFDMSEFFFNQTQYIEETTIEGVKCEQVKFRLNIQVSVDKETGKPIFAHVPLRDSQTGVVKSEFHTILRIKP